MTQLETLIQTLCPNGVKFVKLGDAFKRLKGTPITAGTMKQIADDSGDITIVAGGKTVVRAFENEIPSANIIRVPAVLVQSRGVIDFLYYDTPFTFKNEMWAYTTDNQISVKYLYYVLQNDVEYFRSAAKGMGALPQISLPITENYEIPLPPLAVQSEIVRILDKLTLYKSELAAELAARLQQYEYYRDQLLTFDDTVKRVKLGEVGEFYGGLTGKTKEDFKVGNAKFITYKNIYSNLSLDINVDDKVFVAEGEKQNTVQYGDVLFTGSSETPDECGMSSVLTIPTEEKLYLNSFCFGWRLFDKSIYLPDFLKHLFRCSSIRKEIGKTASGVTRFNVSKAKMANISIPLPSLEVQERIVSILDRFDTLCHDIREGLPAEIDLRQKQYEHYRDRLLTFEAAK